MRIERRSDVAEFFDLVAQRRSLRGDAPLVVREKAHRGEWCVEVSLRLVPSGLRKIHQLKLVTVVGHYLADTPAAAAWPTHSLAIQRSRDVVQAVRRGGADAGLRLNVLLVLTDLVRADRPSTASMVEAAGGRLAAMLAHCKRRPAA